MAKLEIDSGEFGFVDSDCVRKDFGREGLYVFLKGDLVIHFEDEQDALAMARAILSRLGEAKPVVVEEPWDPYKCKYCGTTQCRSVTDLAHHLQTEHYEACVADNRKAEEASKQP